MSDLLGYKKEVAVAVVAAVALAALAGAGAVILAPGSSQTSRIATTTTSSASTTTLGCSSPNTSCGGWQLFPGNLTVQGNSSVLEITLRETGEMYIGSATVYVNGTVIGTPPTSQFEPPGNIALDIQPGQQAILVLTIPSSTVPIQPGRAYSVMVYAWEGPLGQRASGGSPESVNITAT